MKKVKLVNGKYPILYVEEKEIHLLTMSEVLDIINDNRNSDWINYTEKDWFDGWDAFVENEGYYKLYPSNDTPNVQLKNVIISPSTDVYYMHANLFIDGVKCWYCIDHGTGGGVEFTSYADSVKDNKPMYNKITNLQAKLNLFIDKLADKEIDFGCEVPMLFTMDLDLFFEDCINYHHELSFLKARKRKEKNCIVCGSSNGGSYKSFKLKMNVDDYFIKPKGIEVLQNIVNDIILKEKGNYVDFVIYNTNLRDIKVT